MNQMKNLMLVLATLVIASVGYAEQVCTEMPEGIHAEPMKANFDGSITYTNPQILVNGEYIFVVAPDHSLSSDAGLCMLLGKTKVSYSQGEILNSSAVVAVINVEGKFFGVTRSNHYISQIICK